METLKSKLSNGGKFLVTADAWFVGPDGEFYNSAFGEVEILDDEETLGIKTNRGATNWFAQVGNKDEFVIIAGCQIHYAVKCDSVPDAARGYRDKPQDGSAPPRIWAPSKKENVIDLGTIKFDTSEIDNKIRYLKKRMLAACYGGSIGSLGKIVKETNPDGKTVRRYETFDHYSDATRYAMMAGTLFGSPGPNVDPQRDFENIKDVLSENIEKYEEILSRRLVERTFKTFGLIEADADLIKMGPVEVTKGRTSISATLDEERARGRIKVLRRAAVKTWALSVGSLNVLKNGAEYFKKWIPSELKPRDLAPALRVLRAKSPERLTLRWLIPEGDKMGKLMQNTTARAVFNDLLKAHGMKSTRDLESVEAAKCGKLIDDLLIFKKSFKC